MNPGQNQKPYVIANKMDIAFATGSIPADKPISCVDMSCSRRKGNTGQWFFAC